jgi:hypothetical protein
MVALQDLDQPHKITATVSNDVRLYQLGVNSYLPSVQRLIRQVEAKQELPQQGFLGANKPGTPAFTQQSQIPSSVNRRVALLLKETIKSESSPLSLTATKGWSTVCTNSILSSPPKGSGEDISLRIGPHLRPSTLSFTVNSTIDEIEELPPLPDSPLALAKFGLISLESFNTSVRHLVQQDPDSPIGGMLVESMEQIDHTAVNMEPLESSELELPSPPPSPPNPGTKQMESSLISRSDSSDPYAEHNTNNIFLTNRQTSDLGGKALTAQSTRMNLSRPYNISIPAQQFSESGNTFPSEQQHLFGSSESIPMVTAPDTPSCEKTKDHSGFSYDGPGPEAVEVRDFATNSNPISLEIKTENLPINAIALRKGCPSVPDCCLSPEGQVVELRGHDGLHQFPEDDQKAHFKGIAEPLVNKGSAKITSAIEISQKGINEGNVDATQVKGVGGLPVTGVVPRVESLENNKSTTLKNRQLDTTAQPIPTDITGQLVAPPSPPLRKRRRTVNRGHTVIRKARKIVLRRRILAVVVGRQLAKPTKEALRLISQGIPIQPDADGIREAGAASLAAAVPGAPSQPI